jgi:ring-1,2-phenylacetyl-CoA epoxidase subunit PaaD
MVKRPDDPVAAAVWEALAGVHDPEIPPCAITDLGIVEDVRVVEAAVEVDLLPTFAGCPALDVIREDCERAVAPVAPGREVRVRFVTSPPWTSDRITAAGREALRIYGLAPPAPDEPRLCPYCGSRNTLQESQFGPTLCRATHYCANCRNPFEAFKPKRIPLDVRRSS